MSITAHHASPIVSPIAGPTDSPFADSTADQRRRRHLSVYHRALRSAHTPEQRATVAARYRQLFAVTASS